MIISWYRLSRTTLRGMAEDEAFRALAISVLFLIALGTGFYAINQSWNVVDSFYFSVMTLTTIGYGDLAPTGDVAKLFTVAYALSGIGLLVAFGSEIARRSLAEKSSRSDSGDEPG